MNKQQYDHAHHMAEDLHRKVRDLIDDPSHHLGRELVELGHRLVQDIKCQKSPRSLENNVKSIVGALKNIRAQGDAVMDFRHTDFFIKNYEQFQMSLRQFDNY